MNLFDNTPKKKKNSTVPTMNAGSFEDMMKARAKELPELEKSIEKFFKDYDGGLVLMMKVNEDENGEPVGMETNIVGTVQMASQIRLIKNLDRIKDKLIEDLLEAVKDNPEAMITLAMETVGKDLLDSLKKEK